MGCFIKSSGGKAQIVSAVAEFEKDIIKERAIASEKGTVSTSFTNVSGFGDQEEGFWGTD